MVVQTQNIQVLSKLSFLREPCVENTWQPITNSVNQSYRYWDALDTRNLTVAFLFKV